MLPRITCHHSETVLVYLFGIISISLKSHITLCLIVGIVEAASVLALIVRRLLGSVRHIDHSVRMGIVHTEIEVQSQVLETVNLIVELGIADEAGGIGPVVPLIQSRKGVERGLGVVSVRTHPHGIVTVLVIHRLGRVILNRRRNGRRVGETVFLEHTLTV